MEGCSQTLQLFVHHVARGREGTGGAAGGVCGKGSSLPWVAGAGCKPLGMEVEWQ